MGITQTTTSVSTSVPCNGCLTTNQTQIVPYSVKGLSGQHIDLGPITYSTSLSGFTWNVTSSQSITFGVPSVVSTISYNSSLTSISLPGLTFYYRPQGYQALITITGTGAGLPVCIPVSAAGGQLVVNGTQATIGNVILSWSDIPASMNPSLTVGELCFTPPVGPYTIDPLALDGSGSCSSGATNTCNATLTTSNSNDVVIIATQTNQGKTTSAPTVPGGCTGLTNRANYAPAGSNEPQLREDYCIAASALSSQTFTCNASINGRIGCIVFGVSGASTSSPFDSNAALPCKNTGTTGASTTNGVTCTHSTTAAVVFNIALLAESGGSGTFSHGTSGVCSTYTCAIIVQTNTGLGFAAQDASSTAAITSSAFAGTYSLNGAWSIITDGLVAPNPVTQPIKITLVGTGTATVSISGCAVSNSSFTIRTSGTTAHYSSVTASCSITLTAPSGTSSTRYCWNISPKPTCSTTTISFTTCAGPGTCSTYSNSTYYQPGQNFSATPQTPNKWDGGYSGNVGGAGASLSGTFLGVANTGQACQNEAANGGITYCVNHGGGYRYYDYNTQTCYSSQVGNSWFAQTPRCFTDTTGGNTHNVNYVQLTGGGGNGLAQNDYALSPASLILPLLLGSVMVLVMVRRPRAHG